MHRILIVGGGAGGLGLATRLGNTLGKKNLAEITLVDANLTHIWKPLFHEVAAGSFNSSVEELNYVAQAKWNNFRFQLGQMSGLDRENKTVWLNTHLQSPNGSFDPVRAIKYDTLVIAVGSESNDFGTKGVQDNCFFLDSRAQAEKLHKVILHHYLNTHAANESRPLRIAIVGAGATGVELSAELHHAARLANSYGMETVTSDMLKIQLIEAGPRILPVLSESVSARAQKQLEALGVQVSCNMAVSEATPSGFHTKSGEFVEADVKLWAAGIKASSFLNGIGGLESNRINQLVVTKTLQTTRDESIFALGDCAACPIEEVGGRNVPPRAQAAHQQAEFLATYMALRVQGKQLPAFKYKDYGTLISLASFSAVGTLMGGLTGTRMIEGLLARWFYMSLYKMHQAALYGKFKAMKLTISALLYKRIRPKLRLH